jgi:hypothetical protein
MVAIAGYEAALLISSPPSVALPADLALQDSGDHQTFVVSASASAYRYWDPSVPMTFQTAPDGATWSNVTPATVQYVGGKIVLAAPISGTLPSARVTAGNYYPYAVLANVTQWTFDGQMNFADNTTMSGGINGGSSNPFKTFQPMLLEGSFSLTKFWVPESSLPLFTYLTSGQPLILSGVEATGNRYEGYCYDKKMQLKSDVSKLLEQTIDLQVSGNFYQV